MASYAGVVNWRRKLASHKRSYTGIVQWNSYAAAQFSRDGFAW